tara:strand:+ start:28194 stop:29471 length:1278 start_codon:yes stop_codon:yes gene_type:complete
MVKSILKYVKQFYERILQSIAFYPVLLGLLFLILAILILQIENLEFISRLKEQVPNLFISDYETARSILTTLIGGIISLTVFSFSMVMVVLNQASSNFSPRLLPNLVSNKKHQLILGVYIGTLLYSIFVLIVLGAQGIDSDSVGLSTMLAAILAVLCIALFVYFIHNISTAIQINNIIERIYTSSLESLQETIHEQQSKVKLSFAKSTDFKPILSNTTGYFNGFDTALLSEGLKKQYNQIHVLPYLNQHLFEGDIIAKVENSLSDADQDALLFCFNITSNRHGGDKGVSGLIKLMEIAVKAMSPGINDPGTAIEAIVKLGELLYKTVALANATSYKIDEENIIIVTNNISIEELLRIIIQPLRFYAREDCLVLFQLVKTLQFVKTNPSISSEDKEAIENELEIIKSSIERYIENINDTKRLLSQF